MTTFMTIPGASATATLITTPHLDAPDDFYEALIDTHRGLDEAASHALNARLVLLLANHIGSLAVLREALAIARQAAGPDTGESP
jgi:hypothetical protein